jgi:hypothetical protein
MELEQKNNSKIIIYITLVILGLAVGSVISGIYFHEKAIKSSAQNNCPPNNSNQPSSQSAQTADLSEFNNISGPVEKIDGDKLTVKAQILDQEKIYTVNVTKNTKVLKNETIQNPDPHEGEASLTYKEIVAKVSDLKENDYVNITASENIPKDANEFDAAYINFTPPPEQQ